MKTWRQYSMEFRRVARASGFDELYVQRCLTYAHPLYDASLPIIYTQDHFCRLVGVKLDYVLAAANAPRKFYRSFNIAKRTGGSREILEPLPTLKATQRWILDNIAVKLPVSRFAKGFVKAESIRSNARFHRAQRIVVKMDLRDFFGSIKHPVVYGLFASLGYDKPVAMLLSKLCTNNESLPQGAPTSPTLANAAAFRLDLRLAAYCRSRNLRFTRYADDITISGDFSPAATIATVERVARSEGYVVNHAKTKVLRQHQRQIVTGIVVNSHLQVPRERRRDLRQAVYFIEKYGIEGHIERTGENRANYIAHLRGLASFVLQVSPNDRDALHARQILHTLSRIRE